MRLILMGLRGAGKSTLGRLVSDRTGSLFVDLDDRTARHLGAGSVAEAWHAHGEAAFRRAEVECLRRAMEEEVAILALGGGTPTAPGAEALLLARGPGCKIVYLRAAAEVLSARIRGGKGRPSLTGGDPAEEVGEVLERRDPLYLAMADEVIDIGVVDEEGAAVRLAALHADGV